MQKELEENNDEIYCTLVGQICLSIGILNSLTEDRIRKEYEELKKRYKHNTRTSVIDICDEVYEDYNVCKGKDLLVLLWDETGIFAPQVTFNLNGNIYPLHPSGIAIGAVRAYNEGSDNIGFEYIYQPEDEEADIAHFSAEEEILDEEEEQ